MPDPRPQGRMIRRSIAVDRGVARLDATQTAVFCMLLPHLDSHGKMIGEPAYLKEVALPFATWATVPVVEDALKAINRHTSVKWFKHKDGRRYLHAVQFERHQKLEKNRLGADLLPSHPKFKSPSVSPTQSATGSPTESGVSRPRSGSGSGSEVEGKEKEKEAKTAEARIAPSGGGESASASPKDQSRGNGAGKKNSKAVPGYVADIIFRASPDLRTPLKSLYEMVRDGETKVESARGAVAGRLSAEDLDTIFPIPSASLEQKEGRAIQ